nr:reverse transcriptase domain-containing protein [Tanacetum cinerariifolium]GFA38074.1 reverse transcriptase domain-containing protein [Tanacetum cinerariifolium]
MLKARKLSYLIKEIKQNNRKEQPKVTKKGETSGKDKVLAILMVQPWERLARQRITQSLSPNPKIFFLPLGEDEGTKGPMIIMEEIRGHCVHRMYMDGGSASEIMYKHWFSRLRPKIKNQLIPATTPLIRLSGEIIWPIGQIQLLVKIGDEEHSALAWIISWSQKKRGQAADKNQAIQEEVRKLIGAGVMREVHYHDWLSNPVMECWSNYQRLVEKAFHKQISRNLEVYVDDLIIKIRTEDEIVRYEEETLKTLREINMKLNPKKYAFGVKERMFLGDFHWTTEAEEAAELPMLTQPMEKEELIVYLAAAKETVSAVLMTEREAKQMPIYFASRALRGPKLNYMSMEKLILALVHDSKRLKRVSVKGQILADVIVKRPKEDSLDTRMEEESELLEPWILFTDESSCTDGSGPRQQGGKKERIFNLPFEY